MQYYPPLQDSNIIDGLRVGYLKFFGFWKIINDYRTTGKKNTFMIFKFYTTFIISTPYIVPQLFSYFAINMDIEKATIINLHCLPAIMMCGRILVFWVRMDSQCKLYNLIQKDFLHIPQYKMAKASIIYRKITKNANLLCILAFVMDFSVAFAIASIPGVPVDYILYHKGSMFDVKTGRKKILSGWYPLPMDQSPYYEIIFAYEMVCVLTGGLFQPIYICLFYQVLVALIAQFEVLGYHVSTFNISPNSDISQINYNPSAECSIIDSDSYNQNNINSNSNISHRKKITSEKSDSDISEDLYRILQDHQTLLSYADELRSVYNPLVTMNLGLAICFLIVSVFQYQSGETRDIVFVFKALLFMAAQMIELFMFCFGSSSLQAASSDLQLAVYSSDWYKADVKLRKTAQMLMVGAKKGVTLTAIKMYPVNKETLMSIFQFAYSTSALMSGMLEK
ncbi:odorant receptor 10-like [Halyomorpha halys]|uniref:odorant receptor 10-like n=1 Tax=Halyomorpha halys TaxID=286706 RepID=UPI0006D4ED6C|nr:Odorant receptor 64 [Halyomorpha halys]